jgi:hypothetical protein
MMVDRFCQYLKPLEIMKTKLLAEMIVTVLMEKSRIPEEHENYEDIVNLLKETYESFDRCFLLKIFNTLDNYEQI